MTRRALVLGLDCVPPKLAFERFAEDMPHLRALRARGLWGPLRSTIPPITLPAWVSMFSGKDPGELGIYGFRAKASGDYALRVIDGRSFRHKRLWDRLGEAGKRVACVGVPLTWPPPPVRGTLLSCFLMPEGAEPWCFPAHRAAELHARFGPYRADVDRFGKRDREALLEEIHALSSQRFAIASHLWRHERPDFLAMVDIAPDRFHHLFWDCLDPEHPDFDPRHEEIGRRYYAHLDRLLGELLDDLDAETLVMVVSDHGAQPLLGGFAINEWLRREGYLVLRTPPQGPEAFDPAKVDWPKTKAWAEGGHYSRIFINLEGREAQGCVAMRDYEGLRKELERALEALPTPSGHPTQVLRPEDCFRECRDNPPDLMLFCGDMAWRCLGTLGLTTLWPEPRDCGPDRCNHAWEGIACLAGPSIAPAQASELSLYDIAPTVAAHFGLESSTPWRGKSLQGPDRSGPLAQLSE